MPCGGKSCQAPWNKGTEQFSSQGTALFFVGRFIMFANGRQHVMLIFGVLYKNEKKWAKSGENRGKMLEKNSLPW
jgi:hypothetical protein